MVDSTIPLLKANASWYRNRLRLSSFFAILNYYFITKKTSDDTPQKMLITMLRAVLQILESVIVPELGIEIMAI